MLRTTLAKSNKCLPCHIIPQQSYNIIPTISLSESYSNIIQITRSLCTLPFPNHTIFQQFPSAAKEWLTLCITWEVNVEYTNTFLESIGAKCKIYQFSFQNAWRHGKTSIKQLINFVALLGNDQLYAWINFNIYYCLHFKTISK